MPNTVLSGLINPQVMADMISANVGKHVVVAPIAKIDTTLQGVPGDTITVPQYAYIGDAADVAEGVACGTVALTASSTPVQVKKAMKAITITDEAVMSGYGDPVGEGTNQLGKAIDGKLDEDAMTALQGAQLIYNGTAGKISYNGIVDAIDLFNEELNSNKVMFINPKQVSTLRKDSNFISNDKYNNDVIMTGEIGKIANARIVPSKRVPLVDNDANYACPIVSIVEDATEAPALTIYVKSETNVETERHTLSRTTDISADKCYAAALSNNSKVVLAKFKA